MRILSLCALLGAAVAVLAGASFGSTPRSPRATAPRLIAHDLTAFPASNADPEPLRGGRRAPARLAGPRLYNDSALSASTVLNPAADISRTQLVVAQNGSYDIRSRTTGLLGHATAMSFWGGLDGPDAASLCATAPQGEPSVAYDWAADRWVVSEAAYAVDQTGKPTGAYVQCVAVSTSPDATGTWSRYVFQVSTSLYADRPALGVWSDGYYLSFNQLADDGSFSGAGALVVERSKMLTGAAAQARYFDLSNVTPKLGGMLPATITGSNQPVSNAVEPYLQMHDDPLNINDRLEVWGFHVDWTAPSTGSTFQPVVNIPLAGMTYDNLFACTKPNTTTTWASCLDEKPPSGATALPLDPLATVYADASDVLPQLGGRLQWGRSSGGNESMSVAVTMDGGGNQAKPAWFRLQNVGGAGWSIGSRGFVDASDALSRYLPSAAFDNSGNVGVGYVKVGGAQFPGTAWTEATAGSFSETDIGAGSTSFTDPTTVFGGQTTLALDPVDLCTMWFAGPLPDGISLDDFTVGTCTASTTQVPLLTSDPSWTAALVREGLTITGNAGTFTGATTTTYQWRRCDTSGLNCLDIVGENATTHVMTAADASGTHTLRFMQIGTNANGSSKAVSTATTLVQSIPPVNTTLPVISGTAQSGQTLATSTGSWTSSSPVSYTYRWRRCSGGVCANIGGANASTYLLTDSDVGSTVDVVVSATNTGGGTDANASATSAVVSAPVASSGGGSSSGGGGGGGGGGAGSPDLKVTGFASNGAPKAGDKVEFVLTVTDANLRPAQSLYVNVSLSNGLQYVSSSADRGSACAVVGTGSLRCFLDWLSGDAPTGILHVVTQVAASGPQTLTATATSQQGVLTAANSTLTLTLNAASASGSSTAGTPPAGLNGSGTSTTKVADKRKPSARALTSTGARGRAAKLRFRIYDDHGFAKAFVTVTRNGKKIGTARTGYGPVAYGSTYYVGWKVPKRAAKGTYRFCVVAYDRASNHSPSSCAPLSLR